MTKENVRIIMKCSIHGMKLIIFISFSFFLSLIDEGDENLSSRRYIILC